MKPLVKKILIGVGAVVGVVAVGGAGFVWSQTSGFDSSMEKVYDVPLPNITVSTDSEVLARGKHLAESLASCAAADCHGADLAGGVPLVMGPLGTLTGPNLTSAGLGAAYSDAELARLITSGIKRDGRSVRFMPAQEFGWLPDSDVAAIVSYVRSVPPVEKPPGPIELGTLAKVLDQQDKIIIDVARRVAHAPRETPPAPEPTAAYGKFIAKLCTGCHGDTLGGGPIPGAPSHFAIPSNITPDETGLKEWTFDDFQTLLDKGTKKNGEALDKFMPLASLTAMDEIEGKALWAYLQSVPSLPFGSR